jgi:hypothetical protein
MQDQVMWQDQVMTLKKQEMIAWRQFLCRNAVSH